MPEIQNRDYYSTHADEYHRATFSIDPAPFLAPLAAKLAPHASVLDIGCGSGRDLNWFKLRGFKVTGLERSPGLARYAREIVQSPVLEVDFEHFDFSTLSVDAILSVGGLVHVPQARVPALLQRFLAALRPRGLVLLTLKQGSGSRRDSQGREFFLWSEPELRAVLRGLGLAELDTFRNFSRLGTGEVWLGYVLRKPGKP